MIQITSPSTVLVDGINFGAVADVIRNHCFSQNPPFTTSDVQAALEEYFARLVAALAAERDSLVAENAALAAVNAALAADLAEHQRLAAEAETHATTALTVLGAALQTLAEAGVNVSDAYAAFLTVVGVAKTVAQPVIERKKAALGTEIAALEAARAALG